MKTRLFLAVALLLCLGCASEVEAPAEAELATPPLPLPDYTLSADNTHNKFSRTIPAVLTVPAGAIVELETQEATGGQLSSGSNAQDLMSLDFDLIHALTGPIHVETAMPGDVLAVTLHDLRVKDWAWTAISPGFGFLADEFTDSAIKIFSFSPGDTHARFSDNIRIPLRPFAGVIGVAPETDEMLTTIPPRANGGNMDDRDIVAGTTVYLPVFVEGALFSIGDTHAAQGDGEVCGTAIEAPMDILLELNVIKGGRSIEEPQYETDEDYAVTGFGETIDGAAQKAARYMIDYLVDEHGLDREEAYMLASVAAHMKIAETVDVPHMLVTMRIPKSIFN